MPRTMLLVCAILGLTTLPVVSQDDGLRTIPASHDIAATLTKVEAAITSRGMKVFAKIDHAAAAAETGLKMRSSTVVIFGSPKSGTPLFINSPTLAIDLPLKILVWQDATGKTYVTYNSGSYIVGTLFARHGTKQPADSIAGMERMLKGIAMSAAN